MNRVLPSSIKFETKFKKIFMLNLQGHIIHKQENCLVYLNQKNDSVLDFIHFKVVGLDTRPYTVLLFRHFPPSLKSFIKEATPYNLVIPFSLNVRGPIEQKTVKCQK